LVRGIAAGAFAGAGPSILVRRARAEGLSFFGTAKRLLILYAGGGLRTPPIFYADVDYGNNPFGLADRSDGAEWRPGAIAGGAPVPLSTFPGGAVLPTLAQIAGDVAVIAGVDHDPFASNPPTGHAVANLSLTTGRAGGGDAGLLALIHRDLPGYKARALVVPPLDVGGSGFARASGAFTDFAPITVGSAAELTGRSRGSLASDRASWFRPYRDRRDGAWIGAHPSAVARDLETLREVETSSHVFAQILHSPALDLLGDPTAFFGGVTNAQVLEVLGAPPHATSRWALDVGLALRMLQLGAPAATVFHYLYDFHSDEKTQLPIDGGDLARQLSGIHFLLHRMQDGDGASMWAGTVVVVMSELGRDDVDPRTGFNSGNGSDHRGSAASRNQVWPIFGGPITRPGSCIGVLDRTTLEAVSPARSIRSVHSTLLALLGIDSTPYWPDPPILDLFQERA
jgi:hypothetical protein